MSSDVSFALSGIIGVFKKFADFCFSHPYPGLGITIGAFLVGCFMVDYGFNLLHYFLSSGGSSIREDKK